MSTQTVPGGASGIGASSGVHSNGHVKTGSGTSVKERRQARRNLEKELRLAARQRRRLAKESFITNPPKPEDIWICELCEYERIFGEPPRALIRRYEVKDRKHRQEELDRKRLLEKAKAKSRKARKNGKLPAKVGQSANDQTSQPQHDPLADNSVASNEADAGTSHSTQSEGDYEGELDEDFVNPGKDPTPNFDNDGGAVGALPPIR